MAEMQNGIRKARKIEKMHCPGEGKLYNGFPLVSGNADAVTIMIQITCKDLPLTPFVLGMVLL